MICVDSEGNFTHPNMIKISEVLNAHNLDVDLPQSVLDISVSKEFKSATVSNDNDSYIFKWKESTNTYTIEYTIIINPSDSNKTIIELEDGDVMGYYNIDGDYYDSTL
nr:hypothetical protein [uncultured Methanobrevibacter sp.]